MPQQERRVAVVTGGASGIGAEVVARLAAAERARVVVADRDPPNADLVARVEAVGGEVRYVPTDVSRAEECEAAVAEAVRAWGRLDVLVAAAGVSHAGYRPGKDALYGSGATRAPLTSTPIDDWQRVLDVNLNGVMFADRAVAQHMIGSGRGGAIVNIGSINSRRAVAGIAPYCVSKAAVWMLTKCLALELAPYGIRVNAVGPGYIDTPMNDALRADADALARVVDRTPLGRLGTPREIADAVVFLAGEGSSFITGSMIYADGGTEAANR